MSYFSIILVIAVLVLLMQLILAVLMLLELRKYGLKHNFYHSSQMSVVDLLERFSRDYGAINLRVNKSIPDIVHWVGDTLVVDNKAAYRKDAFAGMLVVKTLLDGLSEHGYKIAWLVFAQRVIFLLEISALIATIISQTNILTIFAICMGLACIVLTVIIERHQANFFDVVLRRASELLDWDNVEQSKADKLIRQFEGEGFRYVIFPMNFILKLLR